MDLKTWVELIELGLKILAVFGAGCWAVALLLLLRQRELAQAALRKSEAEIRDLELKAKHVDAQIRDLELKAKQQAVVRVDIQPTIRHSPDGSGYIILAVVELTNCGGRNTKIEWKDELPAFSVRLARLGTDGKPDYHPPTAFRVPLTLDPESEAVSHVIRAGGTESIPFALRVSSPGLYLLSFRGAVDKQERAEAQKLGAELPVAWTGNRHVLVGDTPVPSASESTDAFPGSA
jgi:hypothetical protein